MSILLARSLRIGLIGGLVSIYLALVGLVEAFQDRNIIFEVITLGTLMVAAVPLVAGYRAGRPHRDLGAGGHPGMRALAGAVAGAVVGTGVGALIVIIDAVDVRTVLVRASPGLVDFLAFDNVPAVGAALQIGFSAAIGLLGAAAVLLPAAIRTPLLGGLSGVLAGGMLEPIVRPMLGQLELEAASDFLFRRGGLTVPAALMLFAVGGGLTAIWRVRGGDVRGRISSLPAERRRTIRFTSFVAVGALLLLLPQIGGTFVSQVLVLVGLYLLLGLGLNIVVGYAGLLDLGYVAFFAVGAYLTALLTAPQSSLGIEMPFIAALPIVMIGAAFTGVLIGAPVLRLRGDYLAIVTLGFGEIARILFLSDALRPWLGGVQGIRDIPSPLPSRLELDLGPLAFELAGPQVVYYPVLVCCILAAVIAYRLADSRVGRAWNAMREDEQVAEATGVNTTNYKLLAFAMGAGMGCLSGALFAVQLGSIFPGSFDILVSITVLSIIILGGMGSIPGVIVGAFVLIGLPEMLREFADYRLLVYGGILVAMMLLRPEGLVPSATRRRELHEEEPEEEQFKREAGAGTAEPVIT